MILTGSWLGSSASTKVFAWPSLTSLCWTFGPWHITVNIRALNICKQWWVHWRHLVLGVHFWRVPIIRLCMVILLCKILRIWLGSHDVRISRGVLCTCVQLDVLLDLESSLSSAWRSWRSPFECASWLIRRSRFVSEKWRLSAVFSSDVVWLPFRFGLEPRYKSLVDTCSALFVSALTS